MTFISNNPKDIGCKLDEITEIKKNYDEAAKNGTLKIVSEDEND